MEEKRKKIGILGGTFDPIHYGHLLIAENAAEQYALDEVWFMPTGQSPHKSKQSITDASLRCEMIRLAIEDNPGFRLSRLEAESHETNYTYRTLELLKSIHPDMDFYFILGGDSLKDFETWRNPEQILQMVCILAAVRDDVEGMAFQKQITCLCEKYHAKGIFPLHTPNYSVSSSRIRELIKNQRTVRYMLPENVRAYILEHELYRK